MFDEVQNLPFGQHGVFIHLVAIDVADRLGVDVLRSDNSPRA